jgi:hypothetical protein
LTEGASRNFNKIIDFLKELLVHKMLLCFVVLLLNRHAPPFVAWHHDTVGFADLKRGLLNGSPDMKIGTG